MKIRKRTLALVMATVTVLTLAVGSLAYFTDRFDGNAEATAGTLDLVLSNDKITVGGDSAAFKPGYAVTLDYTLTNSGNKSADVKESFVLTVKDAQAADKALTPATPEFQIFASDDVTVANDNTCTVKTGATPLGTVSGNQLVFNVEQYVLNGTGTGAEIEDGVTVNAKTGDYVLVFMPTAGNSFQGLDLTLNYVAQAKQHRNSNQTDAAWNAVYEETLTFGGTSIQAVPAKP